MAASKSKPPAVAKKSKLPPVRKAKIAIKLNAATTRNPSLKAEKQEKPIFKGKSICSIGTFRRNDKNISHEEIAKWIRIHGGDYVKEVTDLTTHLICSIEEFKKAMRQGQDLTLRDNDRNTIQIQRAQRLGKRRCHIVVYDWLEDCLLGKKNVKSLKRENNYTLDRVICRLEQGKPVDAEFFRRWKETESACKELVDNKLYHINHDNDGFEYKIILSRVQSTNAKGKPIAEKYILYLFESHAFPHVYMVGAKLSRPNRQSSMWRTWCHPMTFDDAFKQFEHFFQDKTGIPWDMRLEPLPGPSKPEEAAPRKSGKGKKAISNAAILDIHAPASLPIVDFNSLKFVYTRPYAPRPLGLLPHGYILPENRPGYVPPKVEMEPDYAVSFDVENHDMMAGIKIEVETQRERTGDSRRNDSNVGWDSDSEVRSNNEDAEETESRGRSFSRAPTHSTHFSTLRSESSSDGSRSRSRSDTGSIATPRNNNHKSQLKFNSRRNKDRSVDSRSGYDSQTEESEGSLSSFSRAPTNSTHFSTWRNSDSSTRSNSIVSSGSSIREMQREGGQERGKKEIIEISDSDEEGGAVDEESDEDVDMSRDERMATLTPTPAQNQRSRQSQTRARSQNATYDTKSQSHSPNTSRKHQSHSSGLSHEQTFHAKRETQTVTQASSSSSASQNRTSNAKSLQQHKENDIQQQWQRRPQNERRGYAPQGQGSHQRCGAFGGGWGYATSGGNGEYMDDIATNGGMSLSRGGLGMGGMSMGGWDRGFGPAPNTACSPSSGNWAYGGMNSMGRAGMGGQFGMQGMGSGPPEAFNSSSDFQNGHMNGASSGGGNVQPYGGGYSGLAPFGNGAWGGNWGAGH